MMKPEIIRLNLLKPLLYRADSGAEPWKGKTDGIERLFCFELDSSLALEFQPDKEKFPGALVFAGKAADSEPPDSAHFELPAGTYLFAQVRETLAKDDIIHLAIEVQNEGLWQRLKLDSRYYLRFLSEDGSPVTQIFRAYIL
jgi:hypothetical protein